MIKKVFLILLLLTATIGASANGVTLARGDITELYFDANGDWTIEMSLNHVNSLYDTVLVFYSKTDSACLSYYPSEPGIFLITESDLLSAFNIDQAGDYLRIASFGDYSPSNLVSEHRFAFGNHSYSHVNVPNPGQSLVGIPDGSNYRFVVKDNIQSLGYLRDPDRGILKGYVYDSLMMPMPYQQIYINDINTRTIWTDENGYFELNDAYGMNNLLHVQGSSGPLSSIIATVEPDSTTEVYMVLPVNINITLTGRVLPENQSMTEGCYAIFTPQCPQAPIDTFLTDSEGYFSANIRCGNYYLRFSKEEHIPDWTYAQEFFFDQELGEVTILSGDVIEIDRGSKKGIWNDQQPYYVFGNITIEQNDTLTLEPGCKIYMTGYHNIDVFGTLKAVGTENDSIVLDKKGYAWGGFTFEGHQASSSELSYCDITTACDINLKSVSIQITYSSNGLGTSFIINGDASPSFINNRFTAHFHFRDSSYTLFQNNILSSLGGTLAYFDNNATAVFEHNTIYGFWTLADIFVASAQAIYRGNIIMKGGYIRAPWWGYDPDVFEYNTIFDVEYELINISGFGIENSINNNGDTCDIYYNIFRDPLLEDPDSGNFNLQYGSQCIDAGDPSSPYDPDNTIADIGAIFFDQLGIYIPVPSPVNTKYELFVVPNPNKGNFYIEINCPENKPKGAELIINGLNGTGMCIHRIQNLNEGKNTIGIDATACQNLCKGTYFCSLLIENQIVASTKIIIQ